MSRSQSQYVGEPGLEPGFLVPWFVLLGPWPAASPVQRGVSPAPQSRARPVR